MALRKTDYYPTRGAAEHWFATRQQVRNPQRHVTELMAQGKIHFGLPPFKAGERPVTIDGGLRYAIFTEGEK